MPFLRVGALVYRMMAASGLLEREDGGAELGDVDGPDGRDVQRDRRVCPHRGREPARGVDRGEGRAQLGQMGPLDGGRVPDDDRVGPAEGCETLTRAQNVDGAPKLSVTWIARITLENWVSVESVKTRLNRAVTARA